MAGNTFGQIFKVTTFGESHGEMIGVVVDGCPAGLELDIELVQCDLDRRRPGQSKITTQRQEHDEVKFISGLFEGKTTGMPIAALIENKDARSKDYDHLKEVYRPSHADFTWDSKYSHRDPRGGGRSSARETACRVVAGAIAKQILAKEGISVVAYTSQIGEIKLETPFDQMDLDVAESTLVRCPDLEKAKQMEELVQKVRSEGDTIGGVVTCVVRGVSVGLGEPVFDRLHADLAKATMSINAAKGFQYGSGFEGVVMKGSEHNDPFSTREGQIVTTKNDSGGIQGGVSNGMPIYFKVAFKPVATLLRDQKTVDRSGVDQIVKGQGRHDPCVVPRAVVIVEAMTALTLMDHLLRAKAQGGVK